MSSTVSSTVSSTASSTIHGNLLSLARPSGLGHSMQVCALQFCCGAVRTVFRAVSESAILFCPFAKRKQQSNHAIPAAVLSSVKNKDMSQCPTWHQEPARQFYFAHLQSASNSQTMLYSAAVACPIASSCISTALGDSACAPFCRLI